MGSLSGTVILCDHVYQAQGGKFVLAGTYTTIEVRCPDLRIAEHQVNGLHLYLRLRPEQLGALAGEVRVRDETAPPWQDPLMRCNWQMQVNADNMRLMELSLVTPPFTIRAQAPPEAVKQGVLLFKYAIEFRIDGEIIATTPFDVKFMHQPPPPAKPPA